MNSKDAPREIVADFFVPGKPRPGGSKKGFFNKKLARVLIVDDSEKVRPWMALVADLAMQAYDGPVLEKVPLVLELTFVLARPTGHCGTGRNAGILKKSAPAYPVGRPDALKLARAVEDALTGVVYRDDAAIVEELLFKAYAAAGGRQGAHIVISRLLPANGPDPAETAGLFEHTEAT